MTIFNHNHRDRRRQFYDLLAEKSITAYYSNDLTNLKYLLGFDGTKGGLLVLPSSVESEQRMLLLVDGRYRNYAESMADDDVQIVEFEGNRIDRLGEILRSDSLTELRVEEDNLTLSDFHEIQERIGSELNIETGDDLISEKRQIKETIEVQSIREAIRLTMEVFELVSNWIEPGISERKLDRMIRGELENRGDGLSFSPLVLSGENTARPHSPSTDREIRSGDPVLVDMGLKINGYCSDLTRMFFCGEVDTDIRELYDLSKRSAARAFERAEAGMATAELASEAHKLVEEEGYRDNLRHGLGHGVGLSVHESPSLSSRSEEKLEPGMVVTLEPGIYIDGTAGGRIEHMVLVKQNGLELLDEPDEYLEDVIDNDGNNE